MGFVDTPIEYLGVAVFIPTLVALIRYRGLRAHTLRRWRDDVDQARAALKTRAVEALVDLYELVNASDGPVANLDPSLVFQPATEISGAMKSVGRLERRIALAGTVARIVEGLGIVFCVVYPFLWGGSVWLENSVGGWPFGIGVAVAGLGFAGLIAQVWVERSLGDLVAESGALSG